MSDRFSVGNLFWTASAVSMPEKFESTAFIPWLGPPSTP